MNNGYENVRFAIVQQAVKDYKRALRKKDRYRIRYFEKWFRSGWGQLLSGNNGEYIIEQCRKGLNKKRPILKVKNL